VTSVPFLVVMRLHAQLLTTVLLASEPDGLIVIRPPRIRDRLVVRLDPRRLDRALASGTPPEASAPLALRAQQLTEPEERGSIARELRRIIRESRETRRPTLSRIVPNRARISAARDVLIRLAEMLEEPGPVAAGGVAQARILLTDGTGPLYNSESRTTLVAGAARALRELRPWPA
jgi:hypothetical protein